MPNIAKVLRQEIARIARREARAAAAAPQKSGVRARSDIAALKREVRALNKSCRTLQQQLAARDTARTEPAPEPERRAWITASGVKAMRKRLGLSQPQFAKLVGVSQPSIYLWEHKTGKLQMRPKTLAKLLTVRGMGARQAREQLAAMPARAKKTTARRKPGRKTR